MMNIYESWLPTHLNYLVHLLLWMLPIVVLQWIAFHRILLPHLRILVLVPALLGTYLIATDVYAVAEGIWFFDKNQIIGWSPFGVPIEEWIFFYLTSLLVTQSFILFLPQPFRLPQ